MKVYLLSLVGTMDHTVNRGRDMSKKATGSTRRVWTNREEMVLIDALKDLVSNGMKSDNGFRTGYLNKLEDSLKKVFPGTDLQANPNITSKLTTWKKAYDSLVSAQRDVTGVGFNTTTNTLELTDDQWTLVVQVCNNLVFLFRLHFTAFELIVTLTACYCDRSWLFRETLRCVE